jgi:hypothetical protein
MDNNGQQCKRQQERNVNVPNQRETIGRVCDGVTRILTHGGASATCISARQADVRMRTSS